MRSFRILLPGVCLLLGCQTQTNLKDPVGAVGGGHLTSTHQLIRPAGQSLEFNGRPVDLVASPDGRTVYVKDNRGLVVIDAENWTVQEELKLGPGPTSVHGIVVTRDGSKILVTSSHTALWEIMKGAEGKFALKRKLTLPGPQGKGSPVPGGLVLSADEKTAYICLSRNNSLAVLDLVSSNIVKEVSVGVAPFDVVLFDGNRKAFVSNWGGRHPREGERSAQSAGTPTLVDEKTVAASGTVSVVDLEQGKEIAQIATGLHPSDLELSPDGRTLYVANANSDTVSVIDTGALKVIETILVRPDPTLLFGSAPNALSLSKDGRTLFVANGGNNAVAVVALGQSGSGPSVVTGFIPTAWYPGGLINDGKNLYVANIKGIGSRQPNTKARNSHHHRGTVSKVEIPESSALQAYTKQVKSDARVPQMLRAREKSRSGRSPVPVPRRVGEPSVIEHVVYIIKENRTYDQIFGDLPQGNGDPSLCTFGREVTPNQHALAEQFVLLDNYYCNGVLSADGHAWVTEGYATDYLEKSFGGFSRSYPFSGDDPISYAASGFIWDHVLLHGLSFRNYGEMAKTAIKPHAPSFREVMDDYYNKTGKITWEQDYQIEALRRYSSSNAPGWQLRIPDVVRADIFIKEFDEYEKRGDWPNFLIIFLPCDHTVGTTPGMPTPRAQIADNDLAVGRIVERISKSRYWPKTCIFAIEDDPQAGTDHVDGHRSICVVASPYTKRGAVVSKFYNQTSVLHTMSRMFGIPPMNQMVALSPLMTDCFTSKPDFTPFECLTNQVPLDELNKSTAELTIEELYWAQKSLEQNFEQVDQADEDTLNRILWHSVKGVKTPYPAELAGAHGKGLRKLGLRLNANRDDDDDD